eukprot:PITA_02369
MEILDEISILSPNSIEEAYQSALKEEEKIARKQKAIRGHGYGRGRDNLLVEEELSTTMKRAVVKKLQDQLKKKVTLEEEGLTNGKSDQVGQRGPYVAQLEEAEAPPQEVENMPKMGEALVLNKELMKLTKKLADQTLRKALFRTVCKSHGKCCKLIINSSSTDSLVASEMVEKLGLKRLKHPTPYNMSWLQKGHQLLVDE